MRRFTVVVVLGARAVEQTTAGELFPALELNMMSRPHRRRRHLQYSTGSLTGTQCSAGRTRPRLPLAGKPEPGRTTALPCRHQSASRLESYGSRLSYLCPLVLYVVIVLEYLYTVCGGQMSIRAQKVISFPYHSAADTEQVCLGRLTSSMAVWIYHSPESRPGAPPAVPRGRSLRSPRGSLEAKDRYPGLFRQNPCNTAGFVACVVRAEASWRFRGVEGFFGGPWGGSSLRRHGANGAILDHNEI